MKSNTKHVKNKLILIINKMKILINNKQFKHYQLKIKMEIMVVLFKIKFNKN